ncbi:hypothetical protein [Halorussus ruber]|nr:hypothetical protein [Halorussus ruber]
MDDGDDRKRGRDDRGALLTDVLDTSEVGTFILDSDFDVVW